MKRFAIIALGLAAILAGSPADAHGPSRLKVLKTIDIAAPVDKVWAIVADFGKINTWLPAVDKVDASGGNTPNSAKRVLHLKSGGEIEEALTKYNAEEHTFSYEITKVEPKVLPVHDYASTMTVHANSAGGTTVEWRGAFYRSWMNLDPPADQNDEAAMNAVDGVYSLGLTTLKSLAEK